MVMVRLGGVEFQSYRVLKAVSDGWSSSESFDCSRLGVCNGVANCRGMRSKSTIEKKSGSQSASG